MLYVVCGGLVWVVVRWRGFGVWGAVFVVVWCVWCGVCGGLVCVVRCSYRFVVRGAVRVVAISAAGGPFGLYLCVGRSLLGYGYFVVCTLDSSDAPSILVGVSVCSHTSSYVVPSAAFDMLM